MVFPVLRRETVILQNRLAQLSKESEQQMQDHVALRDMDHPEVGEVELAHTRAEAAVQQLARGGITIGQGPSNLPKLRLEGKQAPAAFRATLGGHKSSGAGYAAILQTPARN